MIPCSVQNKPVSDFLDKSLWGLLLTRTLQNQVFLVVKLVVVKSVLVLSSFITYHQNFNMSNTMGTTSGAGTAYLSRVIKFPPIFFYFGKIWVAQPQFFFVYCLCWSLFVFIFFRLVIVLSVYRFTVSGYSSGTFHILFWSLDF